MNALLKLSGGIDAINRTIGRIFAWILLPMICLTAFEVFSRYVLKSPTVWAWELIIQIWGLMLMACGGYCYWKGGLVRVDLLSGPNLYGAGIYLRHKHLPTVLPPQ